MAGVIPKIIYSLWLQGIAQAPALVRLNFTRWAQLNPEYQLKILDRQDVDALFVGSDLPIDALSPQALSDVVRIRLLHDMGGIWVDASLFPVKALDEWLPEVMTEAGFFAFERPGPDRPISSWFLVATAENPILRAWWSEIKRFWCKPRQLVGGIPDDPAGSVSPAHAAAEQKYPYFWLHYLFQYLLDTSPEFAALWGDCVQILADAPHRLQTLFINNAAPSETEIRLAAGAAPVQKLNWRVAYPVDVLGLLG